MFEQWMIAAILAAKDKAMAPANSDPYRVGFDCGYADAMCHALAAFKALADGNGQGTTTEK